MKKSSQSFWMGFAVMVMLSVCYVAWGPWGRIPMINMSVPSYRWAQVVFWPGLEVGRWTFQQVFDDFGLKVAKTTAGLVGIMTMGLTGGMLLYGLQLLAPGGKRR